MYYPCALSSSSSVKPLSCELPCLALFWWNHYATGIRGVSFPACLSAAPSPVPKARGGASSDNDLNTSCQWRRPFFNSFRARVIRRDHSRFISSNPTCNGSNNLSSDFDLFISLSRRRLRGQFHQCRAWLFVQGVHLRALASSSCSQSCPEDQPDY